MNKKRGAIQIILFSFVSLFVLASLNAFYPMLDLKNWFRELADFLDILLIPLVVIFIVCTFKDPIIKIIEKVNKVETPYGSIYIKPDVVYKTNKEAQKIFDDITSDLTEFNRDELDFEFSNVNQLNQFLIGETVVSYEWLLQKLSSLFIDDENILRKMEGTKYINEGANKDTDKLSYSLIYEIVRNQFNEEFNDFKKSREIKQSISGNLEVVISFYPGQYRRFCEEIYNNILKKVRD